MKVDKSEYMPLLGAKYPPTYEETFMDVKQRIERGQYTAKTNQLIEIIIPCNPSNYTVWVAKKRIYEAGQTTIEHEDEYSRQVLKENMKNFQLWDYRNFIVSITKDYQKQYALMDEVLQESHKNYHCWSNRVILVSKAKNYSQQIERTKKFIIKDSYNNSIWAYRFYCLSQLQEMNMKEQIQFTISQIKKYKDNQAAWNYLRGFFPSYKIKNIPTNPKENLKYEDYPEIQELCKNIIQEKQIKEFGKVQALITMSIINSQEEERMKFAKEICGYLAELEPLRANYYNWLKNN